MKPELPFDFIVDKEKNTLIIRREFKANRQLVWDCYTQSDFIKSVVRAEAIYYTDQIHGFPGGRPLALCHG